MMERDQRNDDLTLKTVASELAAWRVDCARCSACPFANELQNPSLVLKMKARLKSRVPVARVSVA